MEKAVFAFISDPNPDATVDLAAARNAITVFMRAMKTAAAADGATELTIITGPLGHPLSDAVRNEAGRQGLRHQFGPEWGRNPSTFFRSCDTLVRVGDDSSPWCRQQEELFRSAGGEVFIMNF